MGSLSCCHLSKERSAQPPAFSLCFWGETGRDPVNSKGFTPGFSALFPAASGGKPFQGRKSSAAPAPSIHLPSLPEIQLRPRPPPNTRVTHQSHIAYILGIFLHFDSESRQYAKTYKEEILNIKGRTKQMGVQLSFLEGLRC